jgi:hypothetical protein
MRGYVVFKIAPFGSRLYLELRGPFEYDGWTSRTEATVMSLAKAEQWALALNAFTEPA